MNDILVLKENGSLVKELQANEQAIIYQSLDTTIDNIDLNLKENASLVLLTFNNGTIKDVNLKSTLARGASLTIYNMIISKSDVSLKEEIDPNILVEQAAGITNGKQVYDFIMAGSEAAGAASGIMNAADPIAMIDEMIGAVRQAADDLAKINK